MQALYSQEEANRMGKRARTSLRFVCGLMLCALAVCVFLCTRVRTGNAEGLLIAVIALFTGAGWIGILVLSLLYRPSLAKYRHMTHILSDPMEEAEGTIALLPGAFQIPKSILIRKVSLTAGEDRITLNLDARLAGRLPKNGTRVRVRTAKKYITAIEVLDENR